MQGVGMMDAEVSRLLVEEVKEELDGRWDGDGIEVGVDSRRNW